MPDPTDVTRWIDQVKDGNSVAAVELWHHYYDRLIRAVRNRLRGQNRGASDEEDIVVSVFESFYRAAGQGRFPEMSDRDDLWRLLLKMSARKVIDKRRREQRQRRGDGNQPRSLAANRGDEDAIIDVIGDEPTPEMVAMMAESLQRLLSHLGEGQMREIAVGKMEGFSNAELATRLNCSERTIERRLHLIRETCQQQLMDEDESAH
ncbi:RNA polymerase sigma factor RpoE [Stieleria maiorica]|uniref:RNA polymerase sigma factor RpoE n=1 Tax=Stieleria maiorica TaxID=2795974 RepID=A0A5B9MLR3_9BACT|nr:sigma-70 family RNA polymerase sigma factor [Stieleria maiorica]QEG02289.1 RNA polymerase sigma factor RpoE [Stieleria maiorica]